MLPRSPDEFDQLKYILTEAYGVNDEPKSWVTVASHVSSHRSFSLRLGYGYLANSAKRLDMNEVAQAVKTEQFQIFKEKLEAAVERVKASHPEEFKDDLTPTPVPSDDDESEEPTIKEPAPSTFIEN